MSILELIVGITIFIIVLVFLLVLDKRKTKKDNWEANLEEILQGEQMTILQPKLEAFFEDLKDSFIDYDKHRFDTGYATNVMDTIAMEITKINPKFLALTEEDKKIASDYKQKVDSMFH